MNFTNFMNSNLHFPQLFHPLHFRFFIFSVYSRGLSFIFVNGAAEMPSLFRLAQNSAVLNFFGKAVEKSACRFSAATF